MVKRKRYTKKQWLDLKKKLKKQDIKSERAREKRIYGGELKYTPAAEFGENKSSLRKKAKPKKKAKKRTVPKQRGHPSARDFFISQPSVPKKEKKRRREDREEPFSFGMEGF